jgi:hypothetical protein
MTLLRGNRSGVGAAARLRLVLEDGVIGARR